MEVILNEQQCPKCGGQLEYIKDTITDMYSHGRRCKCKYCESIFALERVNSEKRNIVYLDMLKPGYEVLKCSVVISQEMSMYMDDEEKDAYIKRVVADNISQYMVEHWEDFFDVMTELDPVYCLQRINTMVRVKRTTENWR